MKKILKKMICSALFTAVSFTSVMSGADQINFFNSFAVTAQAAQEGTITISDSGGWLESAYVKWADYEGTAKYKAYVKGGNITQYKQLDDQLIRKYNGYWRADALGLKAGQYTMKIEAYGDKDNIIAVGETLSLNVEAHDRSGAAFSTAPGSYFSSNAGVKSGVGAYNNDGTLKDNAVVIYVSAENAKTVSADIITSDKGAVTTGKGFQDIVYLLQKGCETRPVDIRIIGTIDAKDMDRFDSSAEGLQVKGKTYERPFNLTIEGVGDDAVLRGFGILVRNCSGVEFRNFAVMHCMDDSLSLDTDNKNIWIHNTDMFYGKPGSDADQKKGDGTIDVKAGSEYVTISYNHFFDNGKSSLCGMKSEETSYHITYHHNWFDHSDSRHPRIRTMSVHVYNNFFDGNSKYGTGVTMGSSAFVESNVFKDCKYPMLIAAQGSDMTSGKSTFSGEAGGIIKSYNNKISGNIAYTTYAKNNVEFDAYEVSSRKETIPSNVTSKLGNTAYNNFDTDTSKFDLAVSESNITDVNNVESVVTKYAGRGNDGGDFFESLGKAKTTFKGLTDSSSSDVDNDLTNALAAYKSQLISIGGGDGSGSSGGGETTTSESSTETTTYEESSQSTTQDSQGSEDIPESEYALNFTKQDTNGSSFFTVTGNLGKDKPLPTDYPQFTRPLKIESSTRISFKTATDGLLYLVTTSDSKDPEIYVDDKSFGISADGLTMININAGDHVVRKDSSAYLYYIEFVPTTTYFEFDVTGDFDGREIVEVGVSVGSEDKDKIEWLDKYKETTYTKGSSNYADAVTTFRVAIKNTGNRNEVNLYVWGRLENGEIISLSDYVKDYSKDKIVIYGKKSI